jgi:putative phage-type endonuclease
MTNETPRSELKAIGGSTIAVILGLSKYQSNHSLWLKLTGRDTDDADNDAIQRGIAGEPVVAGMFGLNHPEYRLEQSPRITHEEHPFLVASPDRLLFDESGDAPVAGLEIKTADIRNLSEWGAEDTDEVPITYLCQCLWYLGITGLPKWHLAVGFVKSGSRKITMYREYVINRDDDMWNKMKDAAVDFWKNHIETDVAPEITEADDATVTYYKKLYPYHRDEVWAEATGDVDADINALIDARTHLDYFEKLHETLKLKIIRAIGDAEGVKSSGVKITYKTTKPSQKIDWQKIAEVMGVSQTLIDDFTDIKPGYRVFRVGKDKQDGK